MNTFRQMGFQSVIVKWKLEPCKCDFHFFFSFIASPTLIKLFAILSMNL